MTKHLGLTVLLIGFFSISTFGQGVQKDGSEKNHQELSLRVNMLLAKGDSLQRVGESRKARSILKRARNYADSLEDGDLIEEVTIQFADYYLTNDLPDSAETLLLGALNKYPEKNAHADLLSMLGNAYRIQGAFEKALSYQEKAKSLIDSSENPQDYGRIKHNIGSVYESMGNYATALDNYQQSLESARVSGDSLMLSNVLNSIGLVYNNTSKADEAIFYLEKALAIDKKLNNKVGQFRVYTNLAISNSNMGNFEIAISYYNQALELHKKVRKEVPPFRLLYNLGQLYKDTGELDKAEDHYNRSLGYCKQAGIAQGLIFNYGGLANVAELRKNYSRAKELYGRALEVAQDIGAKSLESQALFSLYNLEKLRNNYEEALSYHEKYIAVSDSLDALSREREIEKTKTRLGLYQQEEINTLLREKQQRQQAQITSQRWLIWGSAAVISLILILLYLIYRANQRNKMVNKKLEEQQERLEELNNVKDKMLAIFSHDLRTPMASVKGLLQLFREDNMSKEEMREYLPKVEMAVDQNLNMMDNLLAWTREQMSGLKVEIEDIAAESVVSDVLENFEPQALEKGVELINNVSKDVYVQADEDLFSLILRNLVSNSVKFTESGDSISVRSSINNGQVTFEVADTGVGMPSEKQKGLFSLQTESSRGTHNEKGSGLGLQLCKEFIEKQGGNIDFESKEGEGTVFRFTLPRA